MLRRRLLPLLALPLLVPLVAGCTATAPSALEVNGGSLSRENLQADMGRLAANTAFVQLLSNQGMSIRGGSSEASAGGSTEPGESGESGESGELKSYSAEIVASWLTRELYAVAIHAEVERRDLLVPAAGTAQKESIYNDFGGKEVFEAFPKAFQDRLLRYYRELQALTDEQLAKLGTAKEYWEKNPAEFPATTCVSHILVATEAEAKAALARVTGGEDFAKVAGEVSTDTGSKVQGGDLGCAELSNYVKEFADAAAALPVNKVSDPVKSQFGYHLIKVTKKDERTFDEATVKAALTQKAETTAVDALLPKLADAKVDPRFGSVQVGSGGSAPRVVPPGASASAPAAP